MSTVRKLGVIAMVAIVLMLAACSSAETVPPTTQNGVLSTAHPDTPISTTTTSPATKLVRVPDTLGMVVVDARRMLNSDGLGVQVKVGRVPSKPWVPSQATSLGPR